MPASKEPWFFADELHERTPPRPEGIAATLEEYAALFAAATPQQRVGEISPLYLWSQTAAERIHQARPDALIVAILREPVALLRSLHLEFVQRYVEVEGDLAAGARARAGAARGALAAAPHVLAAGAALLRARRATSSSCAATASASGRSACWC